MMKLNNNGKANRRLTKERDEFIDVYVERKRRHIEGKEARCKFNVSFEPTKTTSWHIR